MNDRSRSKRMLRTLREFHKDFTVYFQEIEDEIQLIRNRVINIHQDNMDFKDKIAKHEKIDESLLYSCRFLEKEELVEGNCFDVYVNHLKRTIICGTKEEIDFSFSELKRLNINQENIG